MTVVEELSAIGQDARTVEQAIGQRSSYGGLHIALHLLPVVSTKPVFECSHTDWLISRNKTDGEPGYIEPNNFLVRVHLPALPLVRELWTAPWLSDAPAPPGLVLSVAQTVLDMPLANAEGEESHTPANTTRQLADLRPPAVPDEARIAQIRERASRGGPQIVRRRGQ